MDKIPAQILIAYDFSDTAELALQHALDLAHDDPTREFHFLVVVDPNKGIGLLKDKTIDFEYTEEVQELATKRIESALAGGEYGGTISMLVHVRIGSAAEQVLALGNDIGANLILLGSHGRTGVKRLLLGSVSERVVREALCPVLVARDRTYADVRRSKIVDVVKPEGGTEYVPPHRYHYTSGVPKRDKAWALY